MEDDIVNLGKLLDRLVETRYRAEEILTGNEQNATTLAPLTTVSSNGNNGNGDDENLVANNGTNGNRKKRSYVPLNCAEVVRVLEDINDMVSFHVKDNKRFRFSTIYRWCDYIFDTSVTFQDCERDGVTANLEQEISTLIANTNLLHQEVQDKIIEESDNEMSRIAEAYQNHTIKLNETMEARLQQFLARKKEEEEIAAQAVEDRELEPTTLPLIWCDYWCSKNVTSISQTSESTTTSLATTTGKDTEMISWL